MRLDERQKSFIGYLLTLAEDRGALADLRSGLGKEPAKMAKVHRYVVPSLCEKNRGDDRWHYEIAALFGWFPEHRRGRSFGAAFQLLKEKSASMEARFAALLNAHPDDLNDHLRLAVSLLKSNNPPLPLDWYQFFDDLLHWEDPEGGVQLRWARDFYRNGSQVQHSIQSQEEEDHE